MAMYFMINSSKGISSVFLAKWIGVRQKTAWKVGHAIRAMMKAHGNAIAPLDGIVELDEKYLGGKPRFEHGVVHPRGKGTSKSCIHVAVKRQGEAKAEVVNSDSYADLAPQIAAVVSPDAHVMTDQLQTYKAIGKKYAAHDSVNHGNKEFSRDGVHVNTAESFNAVLERAKAFMRDAAQPFDVALAATRAGNLFTTHTAVAAGFDRFPPALIEQYLGRYAQKRLGITVHDLLALGRRNPQDSSEAFNMAYLAIRGAGAVNGVSRLHGSVSRHLFEPLFPHWPADEVPIGHVTNGVHTPTWDSAAADDLWTEACGKDRWLRANGTLEDDIRRVSDARLWQFRIASSKSLVEYARERLSKQLAASGAPADAVEGAKHLFDSNALTLGFARRFATYKRPNMLLHDPERLLRLLTNPQRPVQLILAGKAHPADQAGQALIWQWMQFIRRSDARKHVIFLSDYDMLLTEHLVQGVDVWINTPRRPWEASGTSGMKVLVNGGINLSELDGWWAEAYAPDVGWAVGDGLEHGDDPAWDAAEAETLYERLEREVVPEFYARDEKGIPTAWVARMRESMARLTPLFSANRTVRQYTEQHYLPAAVALRAREADKGAVARLMVDWRRALEGKWSTLRFGEVKAETKDDQHLFEAQVYLGEVAPDAVRVELYADAANDGQPIRLEMKRVGPVAGVANGYLYMVSVSAKRAISDYTARVIPYHDGVAVPLEVSPILWQR